MSIILENLGKKLTKLRPAKVKLSKLSETFKNQNGNHEMDILFRVILRADISIIESSARRRTDLLKRNVEHKIMTNCLVHCINGHECDDFI